MSLPDLAAIVREAAPQDLPALCGRLREAELLAEMRLRSALVGDGSGSGPAAPGQELFTYQEAAEFLRSSPSYVETLVRQGKLAAVTLPGTDKGTGEDRRVRQGRQKRITLPALQALPLDFRNTK